MPTVNDALGQQSQMASALGAGVELISAQQEVEFQRYEKYSLLADGTVFWVASGEFQKFSGSLHYATDRVQQEDQTIGTNSVILTTQQAISAFNVTSPTSMWIGRWPVDETMPGQNTSDQGSPALMVAFAQRGGLYDQAEVWHYSGFAVYPAMKSQIISCPADLPAGPIVSNSLPIWLSLPYVDPVTLATVPVFPSFLVPDNIEPPYIVAHIDPERTEAMAAKPFIGPWPGDIVPNSGASPFHLLSASTFARDVVTLILYGFSNATAWAYLASLEDASLEGLFGFANSPIPTDAKRTQVELAALAQKKQIVIEANYLQGAADAIARRLILQAGVGQYYLLGGVPVYGVGAVVQDDQTAGGVGSVAS